MNQTEKSPEYDEPQVSNVSQAKVANIQAKLVRMSQSAAESITADEVELDRSAVADLNANRVSTDRSAMGEVKATEIVAERSLIGSVQAERAVVSGYTVSVVGQSAEVRNAAAGLVIANDVQFADSARTVLLLSSNVQGNVTTLMDTRTALIAGLVAGLFASISVLLGRALFGRR